MGLEMSGWWCLDSRVEGTHAGSQKCDARNSVWPNYGG